MKVLKKILLFLPAVLLIAVAGCILYYWSVTASVNLDSTKLNLVQNTLSLFDQDDHLLAECSADGENGVEIERVPKYTINAFVCAEDKKFFSHHGLDYKRMAAALWKNTKSLSFKEGASTISQQLVKNTLLTPKKTIKRKLQEIKLTKQLERSYSKDEILEMYLNTIYFGHSCFGLEKAAQFYFGCPAEELSLSASAVLAGMIKSPNNYSPLKNEDNCRHRRNYILQVMTENGYITTQQKAEAERENLPAKSHEPSDFAESYFSSVFNQAEELIGENIYGGVKIYTYLDACMQRFLEEKATTLKESQAECADMSFCVTDARTHGIRAFYSTVGEAKRLIGSTIKPLLVYAPALEENAFSPATPILDEKVDYAGYSPRNFDGEYHGYISAREALSESRNVPAVRVLNALGIQKGVAYLKKMGLDVSEEDCTLALALGGMKEGYALPALCNAYATFSNEGKYAEYSFIRKITSTKGETIYEKKDTAVKVFKTDTVTLLNDMLMTTAKTGTAKKLKNVPYEICAKTGTCGDKNGNTDAYCIAYTADDIVGVWLGNADNTPMKTITGGGLPANIVLDICTELYADTPPSDFKKSDNIAEYTLDKYAYEENHTLLLSDPNAPVQAKTLRELFRKDCHPEEVSTYFSRPSLDTIKISVQREGVCIDLCQREYLTIVINREDNGQFETIYQGDCIEKYVDRNVTEGKTYVYSVTPYYREFVGKTIILPQIKFTQPDQTE